MQSMIKCKFASSSTCHVPKFMSCELTHDKKHAPQVVWQEVAKDKEGISSLNKYLASNFVSMNQFVVNTPGQLFTGYGWEGYTNWFHGGNIFNDTATGVIWVKNQVSLGAGKTIMVMTHYKELY